MGKKQSHKYKLLCVDPSPSLRAFLAQMSDEAAIGIDFCSSLAEARVRLENEDYDLVVTVADLPDGSHLDVLSSVRLKSSMALVPVLLLTAGRGEGDVQKALDKGITEVFSKRDLDDLTRYLEQFSSFAGRQAGDRDSLRALLVEDDRFQAAFYKELLEQQGFSVTHVPSGEAAIRDAEVQTYDLILVDIVLAGACSGLQFLRRLRGAEMASAQSIAIAMSAYDDEARRLEALRAGANVFLPKPIQEHDLAAHLKGMAFRPDSEPHDAGRKKRLSSTAACQRCQPCQLTPRESNICALVAAGYSDKRVAEEMGVSYWTVRTHIAHVFKKCEVSNRVELVRRLQGD